MSQRGPQPTILPPTRYTVENCTSVSIYCPVDLTIYGFAPNMGANTFFVAFFGLCALIQLVLGIKYKTWTYMIGLAIGSAAEALGYVGRIMLHDNPWSRNGFNIQITCLIIAPAFVTAGVYLMLKHIILELGPSFSRLRPKYYTWIFIICDIFSLVLQGVGGGIAATADNGTSGQESGNNLMIAGIVWQVVTLLIFLALVVDYALRLRARRPHLEPGAIKLLQSTKFTLFLSSTSLAFTTIFIRCVFRIGEMANGWGNSIMQDEVDFIVLDSVMVTIAVLCLTVFHPGFAFPEMQMHGKNNPVAEFETADREKVANMEANSNGSKKGFFRSSK